MMPKVAQKPRTASLAGGRIIYIPLPRNHNSQFSHYSHKPYKTKDC